MEIIPINDNLRFKIIFISSQNSVIQREKQKIYQFISVFMRWTAV